MSLEQINFPSNLPKCVKWRHKNFIHALLLFLGLFLNFSRWVLLNLITESVFNNEITNHLSIN